jgi:hypothetical protein
MACYSLLPGYILAIGNIHPRKNLSLLLNTYAHLCGDRHDVPPLEAMACGTPVITSDAISLPEAAGEAALMVNPTDVAGLAAAMAALLGDGTLRERLRHAGLARARTFTWTRTACSLIAALGEEG